MPRSANPAEEFSRRTHNNQWPGHPEQGVLHENSVHRCRQGARGAHGPAKRPLCRLLIYDLDTDTFAVEDNPHGQAAQGAGIQAVRRPWSAWVVRHLVSGHCTSQGPLALRAAGVTIYTTTAATVSEALALYSEGKLTEAAGADAPRGRRR